ncbi:MAG: hypothetical protein ACI4T4_03970, partial [Limosilactobacillus sp.]
LTNQKVLTVQLPAYDPTSYQDDNLTATVTTTLASDELPAHHNNLTVTVKGQATIYGRYHYVDANGKDQYINLPKHQTYTTHSSQDILPDDDAKTWNNLLGDTTLIPAGYEFDDSRTPTMINGPVTWSDTSQHNGTAQFGKQATFDCDGDIVQLELKHQLTNELNTHSATRTINITNPDGTAKQVVQTGTAKQINVRDVVTQKLTPGTWQPDETSWSSYSVDIPGYTPTITVDGKATTLTSIAGQTVDENTKDTTININYRANAQSVTINFVDEDNGGSQVGQGIVKYGVTGETITDFNDVKVPEHYVLAKNNSLPTIYTFTAKQDQGITIRLVHATETIDGKDYVDNPSTLPDGVKKDDLIHTVTRTITDNVPGQDPIVTPQTATITRSGIYDEVTKKLKKDGFGDWTKASLKDYTAQGKAGYIANPTSVAMEAVTSDSQDSQVTINYTANAQTTHVVYQDVAGNAVKTDTVTGYTDQTVETNSKLPAGWKISDKSKVKEVPATITFHGASTPDTVITIEHAHRTVQPGEPVQKDETTPSGVVIKGAHESDLNQTITRTINVMDPHQGVLTPVVQTAHLTRTADVDEVTGDVTYGDWSTDDKNWAAYTV